MKAHRASKTVAGVEFVLLCAITFVSGDSKVATVATGSGNAYNAPSAHPRFAACGVSTLKIHRLSSGVESSSGVDSSLNMPRLQIIRPVNWGAWSRASFSSSPVVSMRGRGADISQPEWSELRHSMSVAGGDIAHTDWVTGQFDCFAINGFRQIFTEADGVTQFASLSEL